MRKPGLRFITRRSVQRGFVIPVTLTLAVSASRPVTGLAQSLDPVTPEVAAGTVPGPEFALPIDAETAREIDRLITDLGALEFARRQAASARLLEIGVRSFRQLRTAYHRTEDLEVRLRIERMVHDAYLDEYVYGRAGFLGVTQGGGQFPGHHDDPRIPEGHIGIVIQQVHPDTAASRGGLQQGDVVIAFDSEYLKPSESPTRSFGEMIRSRGPGGQAQLTVLRGREQIELNVTLGRCPPEMVRQGNIQAVSEQLEIVSDRFHLWWAQHFRPPVPDAASDS